MKFTIIVLLSVVSLVVCSIPDAFKQSGSGKGENCVCREKSCTDASCEAKNCHCMLKGIERLKQQEDNDYESKHLDYYHLLIQERCSCVKGCEQVCSPDERIKCTSSAYDRFFCKYQEFLEKVIDSKGCDSLVEDIKHIMADCINKDCKPICSGNCDCDPFAITPKDCGSTKNCVQKHIQSLKHLIKDEDVKDELDGLSIYLGAFYEQQQNCGHLPAKSRAVCEMSAADEIGRAMENCFKNLINIKGPCTAISIISSIKQTVLQCTLKKKSN